MSDRVHQRNSSPLSETTPSPTTANFSPPFGAYVIHVPKEQLHHYRLSENARRYAHYSRRETSRCRYCRCLCWFVAAVFLLAVFLAAAAIVLYLIFLPKAPDYAIEGVAVKGMNLTSPSEAATLSPEFDVAVRADNGNNEKIGIFYETGSSVKMFYKDNMLCDGVLPPFYQPSDNVTVLETVLTGNGVELTEWDQRALLKTVAKRSLPLTLQLRAPVKIKVGSVETWKITVKVDCDITLDQLTAHARIVNKLCSYGVDLW